MPRKRAKRLPRKAYWLLWLLVVAVAGYQAWRQSGRVIPPTAGATVVTHVVDGDTIDVSSIGRVRLIGIDTPERGRPGFSAATQRTRGLCEWQRVRVELCPVRPTDQYGRTRALVYLPDGTLLNTRLLDEGWAVLYTLPPCHVDTEQWLPLERAARDAHRGLWDNTATNGHP